MSVFAKEESSGVHYEYTTESNVSKSISKKSSNGAKLSRRVTRNKSASSSSSTRPLLERGWHALKSVFMPEGFPESVSEDYLEYQVWDTAQALCSTLSGLLSAKAILTGVGVGDSAATPTSAVLQYITRDVTGMAGRILFAWHKASSLDRNSKSWRLAADVMNDLAMFVELLSPLFPLLFLWLACAGSLLRSLVGVAGAATRTALTMHQARAGNIADVTAKDGSQETAVNIAGLLIGAYLLNALAAIEDPAKSQAVTWAVFVALTLGHIYSNYRAVRAVVMETLNDQRAAIVAKVIAGKAGTPQSVLTPKKVAAEERIVWSGNTGVVLGATLAEVVDSTAEISADLPYVISARGGKVRVALEKGITAEKIIEAALLAHTAKCIADADKDDGNACVEKAGERIAEVVKRDGCKTIAECLKKNGWNIALPLFDIKDSRKGKKSNKHRMIVKKIVSLFWGQEEPEGRNDLPPEVMRKIFSMLEYKSDLKAVSLVCRYWHSIARDPLLWMNVFVDPPRGSPFASIYRVALETEDVTLDPMHENWKLLALRSVSMYSLEEAIQCAGLDGYAFVRKGVHDIPDCLPFLSTFCMKVVIMGVSREESILQCHASGLIRYVSQKGSLKLKNLTIVQKDDGKGENELAWVISSAGSGLVVEDCTIKGVHGVFGLHTKNCTTVVKNCDISSERSSVVYAKENAKATFIGCKVHSGKSAGFEMCDEADLTITNCEVFNNKVGFHYYNSAKGTVEGCHSHHNSLYGCFLRSGSNPTITKTVFHSSPYGIASGENGGGVFQDVVVHTSSESGVFFGSASTTEIRKSKIYDNDTGVLYFEGSSGKVIESDICTNKSNGVSIGDRVCVHIEGCKIRGNMSSGIYCVKTVTGIIRGNKIASNKGAILYKIDEQEGLDSDNEIDPDNEAVSPEIERCIKRGVCTYTVTQNVFSAHEYYFCNDCDPTYGKCFCASCAKNCHVGHRLSKRKFGAFYCDCYKMNCKCKVSKQVQELIEEDGKEEEEN